MSPAFKMIQTVLKGYAGSAIKKKLIKLAVEQVAQRLFIALPFLSWGPLGWIVGKYLTKGVMYLFDETLIGAHVLYIYGDVSIDKKAVRNVIVKIQEASKEGLTDEQIKKLDDELADKLLNLMQLGTI